jgi:serine protease
MRTISHRRIAAGLVALGLVGSLTVVASPLEVGAAPGSTSATGDESMLGTDQLIVRTQGNAAPDADALAADAGDPVDDAEVVRRMSDGSWVVRVDQRLDDADAEAVASEWEDRADVVTAEPDRIRTIDRTPNDPGYGNQWHYRTPTSTVFGANLPPAWDLTTGSPSVTVAVLDTGKLDHVDLQGQYLPGYDFISSSSIGNDGNARDSNPNDPGDWITSTEAASGFFAGCQVRNSSWHGTHVAGTIAARTDNNLGVAGVAWNAKILPVRVLGKCGGYDSDIIDGLRWAAGLTVSGVPTNSYPAKVLNLSLGGSGACSTSWQNAINAVTAAGSTVVISAGNSNLNASNASPGNCNGVITVAASGSTGSKASYSNFGSTVEITAPGGDSVGSGGVLSTLNTGTQGPVADGYAYYQGTSMAAPHVAGAAALVLSLRPGTTPPQMLTYLQQGARAFPAGSSCTTSICGVGLLDVAATLQAIPTVPATMAAPTATAGDGSATVSWSPPASDGGASLSSYELRTLVDGAPTGSVSLSPLATSHTVTGLTNGTTYRFQIRAINAEGPGAWSPESNAVTPSLPATVPSTMAPPVAVAGNGSATLTWTPPASDGGSPVTGYRVAILPQGAAPSIQDFDASTTTRTITGLTNGTAYRFQVGAINAVGVSEPSAPSEPVTPAVPYTVPSAPGAPTGVPQDGAVILEWASPDDGGSPITGYVVTPYVGATALPARTFDASSTVRGIPWLEDSVLHTFTVAAVNAAGTGPASAPSAPLWPHAGPPQVTVGDVRIAEDGWEAIVPIRVSKPVTVELKLTTKGGTATAGVDYLPSTALPVSFVAGGPLVQEIRIPIGDDEEREANETFNVVVTGPTSQIAFADGTGQVTIIDDDGLPPQITITDVPSVEEGQPAEFDIAVRGTIEAPISVTYKTASATAIAGSDFTPASGQVSFAAGEVNPVRTVSVPVTDDATSEGVETFTMRLTTKAGLTFVDPTGIATIAPSDGGTGSMPAVPRLRIFDARVIEGSMAAMVVEIDQSANATVLVGSKNGKATADVDFTSVSQTVTFTAGGPTSQTVLVPILDDTLAEPDETFNVTLSKPTGAALSDSSGVVTIIDGDGGPPRVRISDVRVVEGGTARFLVQVEGDIATPFLLRVASASGTATKGADFGEPSVTEISVPAGSGGFTAYVTVPTFADALVESSSGEKFTVKLTLPSGSPAKLSDNVGYATILG